MMDVPFAYSSNGDAFFEHDMRNGTEREIALDNFPTPNQLIQRFKASANHGDGISSDEERAISQPYYSSQNTYEPRYYQRVVINKTVDAVGRGENRLLLVMATGTGKTYTAFQIVYRLLKSGLKHKILYLADRNNLVDQSIQQDFAPLEKVIHKVNVSKDDKATIASHQVYFSLYQQLVGDDDKAHYAELFDKDFFDLIIVDECHRGSAKEDSRWRKILEYFSSAIQIGMTATPKETSYVSNISYFGEPLYSYSLRNGIEDGFLAPFKVIGITTDISDGWRPTKGQLDYYGNEIEDRIYNNKDYDYNIIIADRTNQVASEITRYLTSTDRMQKTIVFCATEEAAERMRIVLVNLNQDMVAKNPDYVVRITGSDEYGKSKLDYFISVSSPYPVIATTSKLLSTGSDCKMTKLIVLDETIGSMTEFKQIIGRGTRLREKEGKKPREPKVTPPDPSETPYVDANGCRVRIINKVVSVYDADGKLLRHENIVDYTKTNLLGEYADLQHFIRKWNDEEKKKAISDLMKERGIDLQALKASMGMSNLDDFDFIIHIAFDRKPLTRKERANDVKKRDFISKYNGLAKEVIEALLDLYANEGIDQIEDTQVLKLDPFIRMGKPSAIVKLFDGKDGYKEAVRELEKEIYKVVSA